VKKALSTKLLSFALVLVVAIGLAGCGSKTNEEPAAKPDNATKPDAETQSFASRTIETKFGNIEIKEEPKRIVALGWGDAETVLALGAEPIGASDWLAFGGEGVGPWLQGAYKTAPAIIGTMEPDYEQIASLEPDLILDVRSSGDEERYNRLAEIATTVGVPTGGDSYLTTSEQQVEIIAKALGKEAEGEELLKKVDTAFEKAREAYPQFAGKAVAVGAYTSAGWGAYVTGDARVDFMTKLGFTNKEEVEGQANGAFYIPVADENLELFDADLTVILPIWVDTKEITNNALYQKIPSVTEGRAVIVEGDYSNAFSTGTVPALLWAIEQLPAMFDKALTGGE